MIKGLIFLMIGIILAFFIGFYIGTTNSPIGETSSQDLINQLNDLKEENTQLSSEVNELKEEIETMKLGNTTNTTTNQIVCGDNICQSSETVTNCPADCSDNYDASDNQIGCGQGCSTDEQCDDGDSSTDDRCVYGQGFCEGARICSNTP